VLEGAAFDAFRQRNCRLWREFIMTARSSELSDGRAVDRSILGEWFAGDDAAVDELLIVFRDSALTEHRCMARALTEPDLTEFANAAHRLRGVALSMGAHALGKVAAALEAAGKAQDGALCRDGMAELETQMHLMVAEVPIYRRPR